MNDWYKWIRGIAAERVEHIEQYLCQSPDSYPDFAIWAQRLDDLEERRSREHGELVDALADIWLQYSGMLAVEMYLAGAMDGGRIIHACISGELPQTQENGEGVESNGTDHAG